VVVNIYASANEARFMPSPYISQHCEKAENTKLSVLWIRMSKLGLSFLNSISLLLLEHIVIFLCDLGSNGFLGHS
jgi:hypothetical protein